MGSFAAVNNFRVNLNRGWGQICYCFSPGVDFRYRSVEKMTARFAGKYMVMRLGIYLSHSIFSDPLQSQTTNFFFDLFLDRRYPRYRKSFIRPRRSRRVKFYRRHPSPMLVPNFDLPLGIRDNVSIGMRSELVQIIPRSKCIQSNAITTPLDILAQAVSVRTRPTYIDVLSPGVYHRVFRLGAGVLGVRFLVRSLRNPRRYPRVQRLVFPQIPRPYREAGNSTLLVSWLDKFVEKRFSVKKRRSLFARVPVSAQPFRSLVREFGSLSGLTKLRVLFHSVYKFFFGYYFRYYPYRFIKIFKTSGFYLTRKTRMSFVYSGWKLRWAYLGRKSISSWLFNQSYLRFLRKKNFFLFCQHVKMVNFWLGDAASGNSLVNLATLGVLPSKLISKMFVRRLKRRERVNPVLYSLIRLVLTRKKVVGLVILRNGRFTKRQRAVHALNRIGRVSYNSYVIPIDYAFSTAILKYSMVGIKVWVSTAPAVSFYSQGWIANSVGLIYPSSFAGFFTHRYWYVWRISNFFRYLFPLKLRISEFPLSSSSMFKSGFRFLGSWNSKDIRAYRRFSKSFVFSRYNYVRRLQSQRDRSY